MFKFNFCVDTEDQNDSPSASLESDAVSRNWLPVHKHEVTSEHLQPLSEDTILEATVGQTSIKYSSINSVWQRLQKGGIYHNILPAFKDHTDVVPAVYEGGLKVWECTWDLLHYLAALDITFKGYRVLELGCGAALPALYTALHGAHITLQDYNEEVINFVTVPNVALNLADDSPVNDRNDSARDSSLSRDPVMEIASKASFYSGDWGDFNQLLLNKLKSDEDKDNTLSSKDDESAKFDIILTSETIYNPECYQKLLTVMTNCLKQDGVILLAAKSHYFGVGGGTLQFINLVKQEGLLSVRTITTNNEGVKREILEMKFKKKCKNMK
ncbi:histidine protein methyltransferase 1 homolog isoform X2 [Panulirus ornatus]|uniref:histidine protein methyltransferase 1 homolog isoform X2 n=1 Tax=Panulirus ornatus TaxID=150431 RepID=UPI003A8BDB2E